MKPGMPPGPNNPLIATTTFTTSDAIEIDFTGVKPTTVGDYYIDFVDSTTGEPVRTTKGLMETKLQGQDSSMGTDLSGMAAGQYDLNIYLGDELVYTTTITLTE